VKAASATTEPSTAVKALTPHPIQHRAQHRNRDDQRCEIDSVDHCSGLSATPGCGRRLIRERSGGAPGSVTARKRAKNAGILAKSDGRQPKAASVVNIL
jgi:hypothetical protein